MKNTIYILVALLFSCKSDYEVHKEKFHNYTDSVMKYTMIYNECGYANTKYYDSLFHLEYRLMYPNGNPAIFAVVPPPPPPDTVCYPIKP